MNNYFEWTQVNMRNLYALAEAIDPSIFQKKTIYINIPLTWETAVLVDVLRRMNSNIIVVPLSSGKSGSLKPGVLKVIEKWSNVKCYPKATKRNRVSALKTYPDIVLDCIGCATQTAIEHKLLKNMGGILELTRSGVVKHEQWVKEKLINVPVIPIDNCPIKRMGEDKHATGLSLLQCLLSLNIHIPSKKVAIIGYGPVGSSCALYLQAIGAEVFIIERDPVKKLFGKYEACIIESEKEVLQTCDIIITATGQQNVLDLREFDMFKNGVILVNMGANSGEWNRVLLEGKGREVFPYLKRYRYKGKSIYEMADGNSVNLVMGASVIEIMDMTFSVILKAMEYFLNNEKNLSGICELPEKIYSKAILLKNI